MNREFLEGLGLEKEAIDKVMAEHGKTVQATNSKLVEVESTANTLQEQLKQRDADINELKKKTGSGEELQGQLQELQDKYKTDTEQLQTKINEVKLNSAVELALTKGGAKNNTAVKALLKAQELELTDEGVKGLDEQLKAVKEENPYLFAEEAKPGNPRFAKHGNPSGANTPVSKQEIMAIKNTKERQEKIAENIHLFNN